MQKLTIFSLMLSASLILILGDLVLNDYLKQDPVASLPGNELVEETVDAANMNAVGDQEVGVVIEDGPLNESVEVELASDSQALNEENLLNVLDLSLLRLAGFENPVLKDTLFTGSVFQFLPYSGSEASVSQMNFFEGENYVGTLYELIHQSDTGSFQSYLDLRDASGDISSEGSLNEVNNYGSSSFYFNHFIKDQTVHLVIRSGQRVYAFEYASKHHESMKPLFELL